MLATNKINPARQYDMPVATPPAFIGATAKN
jgi:hypothetical protein